MNVLLKAKPNDPAATKALLTCDRFIREERFRKAIGGAENEAKISLCQTLNLSSFDANADLANYEGPKLEFEQLYDDKNAFKGAKIKNMSQEFISKMVNDLFLKENIYQKSTLQLLSLMLIPYFVKSHLW